jgi:Zn-dependent peptidase ImmA (M78 family)
LSALTNAKSEQSGISAAERLLRSYGVTDPAHIDLEAIAFHQGVLVRERKLDGCEARIVGRGERAIVTLNLQSSPDRRRFSLAHELGHWVHHRGCLAFACQESDIGPGNQSRTSAESVANRFAADLLMPDYLFRPASAKLPLHFGAIRELSRRFGTSLTATAIRMVAMGHQPGMVACYTEGGLTWASSGPDLPIILKPHFELRRETEAFRLSQPSNNFKGTVPRSVCAAQWIRHPDADLYTIVEDAIQVAPETVVVILWWRDDSQLRDARLLL